MRSLLILLLMSSSALAQTHGSDVELEVVGNKIVTDEQIYLAELGEIIPNEVDEPGFDSLPGTFPLGSSIGFSILDSLRKWDGTDFESIAEETLSIGFGSSLGPVETPAAPAIVDGFDLNVSSDGAWHRHYDFKLNAPASTGVYLLKLQLDSSDASLEPTDPFYILFNQNDTEMNHDSAFEYLESSLAVPEPSSLLLVMVGGLLFCLRR